MELKLRPYIWFLLEPHYAWLVWDPVVEVGAVWGSVLAEGDYPAVGIADHGLGAPEGGGGPGLAFYRDAGRAEAGDFGLDVVDDEADARLYAVVGGDGRVVAQG